MTSHETSSIPDGRLQSGAGYGLRRRLLPLQAGTFAGGLLLWPATEKLFMSEIGFGAAEIGVMAAVYAVLTPVVEIPSGILADRWSRKGLLMLAYGALLAATLAGGLSTGVLSYTASMLFFSLFLALHSGTMEAIVYDTVLEETGSSDRFETLSGRLRALRSGGLLVGSVAGGALAAAASPRATFFATVPVIGLSLLSLAAVREPQLHLNQRQPPLRQQITGTYQAVCRTDRLVPVAGFLTLSGTLTAMVWEFNQLWLLAFAAPVVFYGPFMALLFLADVLGGLLAGRVALGRPRVVGAVIVLIVGASVLVVLRGQLALAAAGLLTMVLVLAVVGIHVNRVLHDAVPSEIRAGVGSGISAFTWILFTPTALGFGGLTQDHGVHRAGWLLVAGSVVSAALLVTITSSPSRGHGGHSRREVAFRASRGAKSQTPYFSNPARILTRLDEHRERHPRDTVLRWLGSRLT